MLSPLLNIQELLDSSLWVIFCNFFESGPHYTRFDLSKNAPNITLSFPLGTLKRIESVGLDNKKDHTCAKDEFNKKIRLKNKKISTNTKRGCWTLRMLNTSKFSFRFTRIVPLIQSKPSWILLSSKLWQPISNKVAKINRYAVFR